MIMTKRIMSVTVGAALLSTVLMAQTTPMKTDKAAKAMAKPATYTGCVAAGTTAGSYMLTHSMMAGAKDMGMDKGAMAKDATMPPSMMLMSTSVDLSKHVGHKVSVTGMMAEPAKTDAMQNTGESMGKAGMMSMSGFTVTSIKMVSSTCGM